VSLAVVEAALSAALRGHTPTILTVAVPPSPSGWQSWWAARLPGAPEAMLLLPQEGRRLWGRGIGRRLRATAHEAEVQALWGPIVLVGDQAPPPALFAALPFDPAAPAGALWEPFGGGGLFLPRWTWEEQGDRAWIRLYVEDPEAERAAALREWDTLRRARPELGRAPGAAPLSDTVNEADWSARILEALRWIREGRLSKVVLARRAIYDLPTRVSTTSALWRLRAAHPGCTVFGLRLGDRTFLGATPERLVRRAGRVVETDALAGTGASPEALRTSEKDRWEHQLVVDAIAGALGPRCVTLSWPATPEVTTLRDLCHLRTPFRGELHGQDSALTLALALHPTPAVGGAPREPALALIQALEPAPRGLYAGPVGWVDRAGDGALWVALRSGVVEGKTLHLYAGVGVVEGSSPREELLETMRKMTAMEAAFSP